MTNFFVKNEIYEERIALCRECVYYFKPTGTCKVCLCFMKVKARIGVMECPQKYWSKTTEVERPDDIPEELIEECLLIWDDIKTGVAKNVTVKKKMVELYNTIFGTNYKPTSNCGTCLNNCYQGIKKIVNEYEK
jgi:5-methylcytosine-specific restriction endonuclease McrA